MNTTARAAYMDASVATASPARLLVMLCERLNLDVERALEAHRRDDPAGARRHLMHAQDIVLELSSSLNAEAWEGGPGLASIYDFLHAQLVRANIKRDADVTAGCLTLTAELCQTWRSAALASVSVA